MSLCDLAEALPAPTIANYGVPVEVERQTADMAAFEAGTVDRLLDRRRLCASVWR